MNTSARRSLLPGVSESGLSPDVHVDSRRIVTSARRRAAIRDAFDLLLLAGVDALFLQWPQAHLPMMRRDETLLIILIVNTLFIGYVWMARALPRWRARRLASTWSLTEQNRFVRS